MAIVIEANYSKKQGLPAYSRHSYSVTIRSEVADLSQVERKRPVGCPWLMGWNM